MLVNVSFDCCPRCITVRPRDTGLTGVRRGQGRIERREEKRPREKRKKSRRPLVGEIRDGPESRRSAARSRSEIPPFRCWRRLSASSRSLSVFLAVAVVGVAFCFTDRRSPEARKGRDAPRRSRRRLVAAPFSSLPSFLPRLLLEAPFPRSFLLGPFARTSSSSSSLPAASRSRRGPVR